MTIIISYASYRFTDKTEDIGGEERVAWETVKWMADRGHKVYVFSPNFELLQSYHNIIPVVIEGCDYKHEKSRFKTLYRLLKFARHSRKEIKRIIRREKVDVIHHLCPAYPGFPSSVSDLDIPFIYGPATVRYDRAIEKKPRSAIKNAIGRTYKNLKDSSYIKTLKNAERILLEVDFAKKWIPERYHSKAIVFHNSINTRDYEPSNTIAISTKGSSKVSLLYHGGIRKNKGIEYLLKAVKLLKDKTEIDLKVELIGQMKEFDFKQMARQLGIDAEVTFFPAVDQREVPVILDRPSIYVFPTLQDNCPKGLLEAMSMGMPIVTTDIMDIPRIARHEQEALIIPVADEQALFGAIKRLAENKELQSTIASGARKRALNDFDSDIRFKELEQIYININKKAVCE